MKHKIFPWSSGVTVKNIRGLLVEKPLPEGVGVDLFNCPNVF